jgi:hypothetical protein
MYARCSSGASITGITLDANADAALSDVAISVFSNKEEWQTRSDREGRFTISGLPAGRYSIEVRRAGFKKAIMDDIPLAGDESRTLTLKLRICNTSCDEGCGPDLITYEVRANGDRLLAIVLSEGKPVANAEMALRSPHTAVPSTRAITNASGGAELDNIPPGQYVLSISASGYQNTTVSDVRLLARRVTVVKTDLLRNGMIRACQ